MGKNTGQGFSLAALLRLVKCVLLQRNVAGDPDQPPWPILLDPFTFARSPAPLAEDRGMGSGFGLISHLLGGAGSVGQATFPGVWP